MKNMDFLFIKCLDVSLNNGVKFVLLYGWLNVSQCVVQCFVDLYYELGYDVFYIFGCVIQFVWFLLLMKLVWQVFVMVSEFGYYEYLFCYVIFIGVYNYISCMIFLQENLMMF